jgi:hypothetical protein
MSERITPSDVRITIVAGPAAARRFARARATGVVGLALIIVAAAVLVTVALAGSHAAARRGAPTVSAAYGYPPGCLAVSFAKSDPSYARADFEHDMACGRFSGYATAIFHRVDGGWRLALLALSYSCPVTALPRPVQLELGVCQ